MPPPPFSRYDHGMVPFLYRVSMGEYPQFRHVNKYGLNPDIDTIADEEVWSNGGNLTYLTSAETMDIASTDAADTAAGTGARTISISGLNGAWEDTTEELSLAGVAPVTTVNSYLRIYRAKVLTAGSGGVNAGDISVDAAASTQAIVNIGNGQTLMSHYTIPMGRTGYLVDGMISVGRASGTGTKEGKISMWMRENPDADGSWRLQSRITARSDGAVPVGAYDIPSSFPEKTDIRFVCNAEQQNTYCYIQYSMLLFG